MSPDEFLRSLERSAEPVYLFLGPEMYMRDRCRKALIDKVLPPEDREQGLTRYDLEETELLSVMDDARSFSLFSTNRLIWISAAEGALPKRMSAATEDDVNTRLVGGYLKNPPPGTVLVFDCSRFDFEGEDKAKLQRVQKFYSSIKTQVEFTSLTPAQARKLALARAKASGLKIGEPEMDALLEVLGADAMRISNEIEKLSLMANGRAVTEHDIASMVPDARASNIFSLVAAIGRKDRAASLDALELLVREGEYLALALTFLGTQFRLALVAKEAKLSNANAIQAHFTRMGTPMWRSRAEQVYQTASAFSLPKLRTAMQSIYETDKALRDARPDDRIVMEQFVLRLTA